MFICFPNLINSLLWAKVLGNDLKKPIKHQLRFNKRSHEQFILSNSGGLFLPAVKLGSKIKKGQIIGSIFDINSNALLELIEANSSGYLVTLRDNPMVHQKEILAILLMNPKFSFWPLQGK